MSLFLFCFFSHCLKTKKISMLQSSNKVKYTTTHFCSFLSCFFYPFCRNLQATLICLYSTKLEQCSQPLVTSWRKHLHTLFWIREYVKYKIDSKNTILFTKYYEVFKKWSILFRTSKLLITIALISFILSHLL